MKNFNWPILRHRDRTSLVARIFLSWGCGLLPLAFIGCNNFKPTSGVSPGASTQTPATGSYAGTTDLQPNPSPIPAPAPTPSPPTYYVDGANPSASDSNAGSATQPWKTLQKAAATLTAGQSVIIRAALYSGNVAPAHSGEPNATITYQAMPGAVLGGGSLQIAGQSYITIDGLRIQNVLHTDGISITGEGRHITIQNNYIQNVYGSCIFASGTIGNVDPSHCLNGSYKCLQDINILNNVADNCNNGGWNENISIASGVDTFLVSGNILKNGTNATNGGEGIDLKNGVSHGIVSNNTIYPLARDPGIYVDGSGFYSVFPNPLTHDILITGNRLIGEGIRVDSEEDGNIQGVRIENNLVSAAPADGICLYLFPGSHGAMDNVTIINNTLYGNSTLHPWWNGINNFGAEQCRAP